MTQFTFHFVPRMFSQSILVAILAAVPAFAQQTGSQPKLEGVYAMTEAGSTTTGQVVTTLASLNISANGTIVGVFASRNGNLTSTTDVQGTFVREADGNGRMTIRPATVTPDETEAQPSMNYRALARPSGEFSLIRADSSHYTTGELTPAPSGASLKRSYALNVHEGAASTRIGTIMLDAAGGLSGFDIVKALGVARQRKLSGKMTPLANGFRTLTVSTEITDDFGETQVVAESLLLIVTAKDLRAIRTGGGSNAVVMLTP